MENLGERICVWWLKLLHLIMATCKWLIFSLCMCYIMFVGTRCNIYAHIQIPAKGNSKEMFLDNPKYGLK